MSNKQSEQRSLGKRLAGVTMPISRKRMRWQRNWRCLCGSDKKYKNCCLKDISELTLSDGDASVKDLPENIKKIINLHSEEEKAKGGN